LLFFASNSLLFLRYGLLKGRFYKFIGYSYLYIEMYLM
jgi:hypothetical protein